MEGIPIELVYILLFIGIIVFNVLMQKAARRRQQEGQAQAETEAQAAEAGRPEEEEEEPLEDIWGRSPAPPPVAAPTRVAISREAPMRAAAFRPMPPPLPAAAIPARRHHEVRELLRDQRDLRRAIMLLTVLGPCRSQEPPDQR
jgi:hypothetical protein